MAAIQEASALAVPLADIRRYDRVVTADGSEIGTVRTVYGTDALNGHIVVVGRDAWSGAILAYAIPAWAPRRRDACSGRLYLSAQLVYVSAHWVRASWHPECARGACGDRPVPSGPPATLGLPHSF